MENNVENQNVEPVVTEQEAPAVERSARDTFNDTVREYAPDGKYDEDENEYFNKANEMIAMLKDKGKKYDDFSTKLLQRFNADPEDAAAFLDYAEGMPLVAAIAKHKGREALKEPTEGEDGWEDFQKSIEERHARNAKNEEEAQRILDEQRKNAKETEQRINALAEKEGWSDEQRENFVKYLLSDLTEIAKGNYSDETIGRYLKSYNYDDDLAAAKKQGEVEGRNAKIDAERKRAKGSGLPNVNGGSNAQEDIEEKPINYTAEWLAKFKHR